MLVTGRLRVRNAEPVFESTKEKLLHGLKRVVRWAITVMNQMVRPPRQRHHNHVTDYFGGGFVGLGKTSQKSARYLEFIFGPVGVNPDRRDVNVVTHDSGLACDNIALVDGVHYRYTSGPATDP